MPIEGLSETRRITRLGKIRLGIKKVSAKTGKEYPQACDYFVCPQEVIDVYGEKPVKLDIMFPLEDEEVIAHQYLKCYSSYRGLTCKGTGKACKRLVDTATGDFANRDSTPANLVWKENLPCGPGECPKYKTGDCREIMNLQFMLPKVPGIGIWQLDTSSINSIIQVNSAIALVKELAHKHKGTLAFTPLELVIVDKEVAPNGVKKIVKTLDIVFRGSYAQLKEATRNVPELTMPMPDEEKPDLLYVDAGIEPTVAPDKEQAKKDIDELWPEDSPKDKKAEVKPGPVKKAEPIKPEQKAKPVKQAKKDRDPASITNWGELFTACKDDFKLSRTEVLAELNAKSTNDLTDSASDCYRVIVAKYKVD
jgi:hypothetical protein